MFSFLDHGVGGQTVVFGVKPPSGVSQRHSPQNAMQAEEDLL